MEDETSGRYDPFAAQAGASAPPTPDPRVHAGRYDPFAEEAAGSAREMVPRAVAAGLAAGTPFEDVARSVRGYGVNPEGLRQNYQLGLARQKEGADASEPFIGSALEQYRRKYMPFGSLINVRRDKQYTDAKARLDAGKATQGDIDRVAHYEELQQSDERLSKRSIVAQLPDVLGKVSGMYGEALVGGGLLNKAGLGGAAATWGGTAGRKALQLGLMPSMWADQWTRKNIEEGRSATDLRGLPPALGLGMANMIVLGRVASGAGNPIARAALGVGESQVVQLGAGLADEFIPKAYQMGTKWGPLGQLVRGDTSLGEAGKHLGLELLTFGAFAGIHHLDGTHAANELAAEEALKTVDLGTRAIDALIKTGLSPQAATARLKQVGDIFAEGLQSGAMAREDAPQHLGDLLTDAKNPLHEWAKNLAEKLPTRAELAKKNPAGAEPAPEPTGEFPSSPEAPVGTKPPVAEAPTGELPGSGPAAETNAPVAETPFANVPTADLVRRARIAGAKVRAGESRDAVVQKYLETVQGKAAARAETAPEAPRAPENPPTQPSPEPEIARPGANAGAEPTPEAHQPARERSAGLRLGKGENLAGARDLNPAEAHALKKYGNGQRVELLDAGGKRVGTATVHETGDTSLAVSWMGAEGLAGGEGRGRGQPFGRREVLQLARQLAESLPEFKTVSYTPSDGRIRAGETRVFDLDKFRPKTESPKEPTGEFPSSPPEPAPAPPVPKRTRNEGDFSHDNRTKREAGAETLADYIRGYGGIDPNSLSPLEHEHLIGMGRGTILTDRSGEDGRHAIDTLAEHLLEKGMLERDSALNPVDQLLRKLDKNVPVGEEGKHYERELARHEEKQRLLEQEVEDARRALEESHGPAAGAQARDGAHQISAPLREAENAPEAPGEGAGAGEARPGATAGRTGGAGPARTPAELKEVRRLLAKAQLDEMSREEWNDLGPEMQEFYKTEYGLTWKPKKPNKGGSKKVKGDLEAIDPEHARVIDESGLPAAEKVGVKAIMAGFSVREAATVAAGIVKRGGRVPSYETLRKRAVALFGEHPVGLVGEAARNRELDREARMRENSNSEGRDASGAKWDVKLSRKGHVTGAEEDEFLGEGIYGHSKGEPTGESTGEFPSSKGGVPGPHQIIATQNKLFGTEGYTESKIPFKGQAAVALTKEGTTLTERLSAGSPDINLEEHAHHLVTRLGMPLDAAQLPPGVAEGFRQFWGPKKAPGPRSVVEGFGAWLVARSNAKLDASKLTEAQRVASEFAEAWAQSKGLTDAFNKVRDLRMQLAGKTAAERFGLLTSKTGDVAVPESGTKKERVKSYLEEAAASQMAKKVDDLNALTVIERQDAAARKAKGLAPAEPGTLPSEVYRATRYRNQAESAELQANGVHYYGPDGKQVRIGKSYERIAQDHGLTAEEIANGGALDQFARAREAVWLSEQKVPPERKKGPDGKLLPQQPPGPNAPTRANRPPDQIRLARQALEEFKADPERYKRLEAAADEVTKLFNDSVVAMEKMGFIEEGTADKFIRANPYYTPNTRLFDKDGLRVPSGKGGGNAPGFTKARSGSGEEMIGLKDAVADRMDYLAYVISKQAKDKAFFEFFSRDGLGDDVLFHPIVLSEEGQRAVKGLKALGMEADEAWAHIDSMGDAAQAYFEPGTWKSDPRRLSYVMVIDGKPVRALVNNKALHEVLTGTQGEGETTMKVAAALSAVSRPIAQLQRLGFTMLSPLYHLHNLMPWRDMATYLGRTTSEKGWAKDVGDVYKWYASSLGYYAQKLIGRDPSNVYFRLYDQMVQRNMDANAALGTGSAKIVNGGWRGLYQKVTDVLGFGEKALHVAEMKNVWDRAGYTRERIEAELAADPTGANPIPFALQVAAYNAAAQVTHNYLTMGYQVRELNKGWPFLGVHIASAYKDIVTMRERPKVALRGLSVLIAAKVLQWAMYNDDEEYKQLSLHRRDGFIFKTPVGWIGMPGPRGIQVPLLAMMDEGLRAASGSNPQFHSLVSRTLDHVVPTGGPAGITTGLEVLANTTRGGQRVVPKWDEGLSASEKFTRYQLPYAANQMSGGLAPAQQLAEGGYDPLKGLMLPPQHETVTRLRELVESLKEDQLSAKRSGVRFKEENRYTRLASAEAEIRGLSAKLNKMRDASAEDRAAVNRRQVAIAKRALGE